MKNKENTDVSILVNKKQKTNNFFSKKDDVKPILAYFAFTTKYILKKKSTVIMPIVSFISILLITLIPTFFIGENNSEQQKEMFSSMFLLMVSSISIAITSLFATVKALNLFKDVSSEGMEILIVSKPIKRSQIIFVRFAYFLFLGIVLCLINYFAILIGLLVSSNTLPESFSMFSYITIYYFSMLMAYVFFGSISIMLSLKFSTKLVSSLSLGILGIGTIFSQVIPTMIPIVQKDFYNKIDNNNSNSADRLSLNYYLTEDGKVIIYTNDVNTPLTQKEITSIESAFNSKEDLSWVINLNNFINPVAGITKIASVAPTFFNDYNYHSVNFSDFKVSLVDGEVKNNFLEGKNHFVNIENAFNSSQSLGLKLEVRNTPGGGYIPQEVVLSNLGDVKNILENNINSNELSKTFDQLLNNDLLTSEKVVQTSKNQFQQALVEIKKLIEQQQITLALKSDQSSSQLDYNNDDLDKQIIIFIFYLYGLDKLNENFSEFKNRQIFIDSIPSPEGNNLLPNIFLNYSFNKLAENYSSELPKYEEELFFLSTPSNKTYLTFVNDGEKVTSTMVGLTWSSIILIVLVGTIVVYYRKDFA